MKWIPLIGIFFIKKNEPEDIVYTYQLACAVCLWPIILYLFLLILKQIP